MVNEKEALQQLVWHLQPTATSVGATIYAAETDIQGPVPHIYIKASTLGEVQQAIGDNYHNGSPGGLFRDFATIQINASTGDQVHDIIVSLTDAVIINRASMRASGLANMTIRGGPTYIGKTRDAGQFHLGMMSLEWDREHVP